MIRRFGFLGLLRFVRIRTDSNAVSEQAYTRVHKTTKTSVRA